MIISAGELTKRRRQKILAAAPLPTGSAAGLVPDTVTGRLWRAQEGCCSSSCPSSVESEFMIALVDENSPCTTGYKRLQICTLFQFSAPIPADQPLTIINLTSQMVMYYLGQDNNASIPINSLSIYGGVNIGETITVPSNKTVSQTDFYFTDMTGTRCPGS